MARLGILVAGALLWVAVAVVAVIHVASGDWLVPAAMVVASIAFVAVVTARRVRLEPTAS